MKNVILFIAHQINECTLRNYYKLLKEKPCDYNLFWGLHDDIVQDTELPKDIKVFHFSFSTLQALGYTPFFYDDGKTFGSVNFILQAFFKKYPDYDYYWSMMLFLQGTGIHSLDLLKGMMQILSVHILSFLREESMTTGYGGIRLSSWKKIFL